MRKSRAVIGFGSALPGTARHDAEPLADLFDRAARGELRPQVGATYPLSEARRAHEARRAADERQAAAGPARTGARLQNARLAPPAPRSPRPSNAA